MARHLSKELRPVARLFLLCLRAQDSAGPPKEFASHWCFDGWDQVSRRSRSGEALVARVQNPTAVLNAWPGERSSAFRCFPGTPPQTPMLQTFLFFLLICSFVIGDCCILVFTRYWPMGIPCVFLVGPFPFTLFSSATPFILCRHGLSRAVLPVRYSLQSLFSFCLPH